ncbi:hypothetical protein LIER_21110 [Lithospermum erythrorhizon]|uniref:Uncharacterized protein n=1 Tax=Lithospermum erythrorhizon TaxID=34254 RepID=A0AAV3QNZ0_LITER
MISGLSNLRNRMLKMASQSIGYFSMCNTALYPVMLPKKQTEVISFFEDLREATSDSPTSFQAYLQRRA